VLTVADALRAVIAKVARLPAETVDLDDARGRVLATDILASRALPHFDNSAMDGYAARSAELPATLPIHGVVAAGAPYPAAVPERAAMRIFTGAPLPPELDTVVIQEDVTREDDRVTLPASRPGENVRRAGEDIAIGERVLSAGTRLSAWDLGLLAALGHGEVRVSRTPRVAILATGDELVDVGTSPGPGQLVASSSHALAALVEELGCTVLSLGIVRDDVGSLVAMLDAAYAASGGSHDVVITTGGVSVGDRDHVHEAFAAAGIEIAVSKVAMKPGKPFAFGKRGDIAIFGLPGNPVSTLVGFELFVRPALLAMQGAMALHRPRAPVRLPAGYRKPSGRAHYLRARLARDGERLVAHPHRKQGSAMLSSLIGCTALVEIAAELTEVPPDAVVPAILLEAV
jgi:molybdopterin molybdotransferase